MRIDTLTRRVIRNECGAADGLAVSVVGLVAWAEIVLACCHAGAGR